MKKSELLSALQNEIQRHNLSTFMSEKDKILQTGCSLCERHFGTVEQFKRHLNEEVLPRFVGSAIVRREECPINPACQ